MNRKVIFDMDGVLAEYGTGYDSRGFFLNLKAEYKLLKVIQMLINNHIIVEICSVVHHDWVIDEKNKWLKKYNLDVNAIFVNSGEEKLPYVKDNVFIDDHTPNLQKASGIAYKCIKWDNGINCKNGDWKNNGGTILSYKDSPEKIYSTILQYTKN